MMKRTRSTSAVLLSLLAWSLAAPAVIVAAPALEVAPDSGPPGATLTARGTGFLPGLPVEIRWSAIDGPVLATTTAGSSGAFEVPFDIPDEADPIQYRVFACSGSSAGCPDRGVDIVTVEPKPTPKKTPKPTAKPTPKPTPRRTARPTTAPTPVLVADTPTPGPTLPPFPSFPLADSTPPPTPFPLIAVTPRPTPPSGLAGSPGPFPDLDILAIEVTQGIQDLNNNMPLVAGRRTYARVHLDVIGANELAHTHGALEARRGGQQIGWIWPENGPITASANGGDRTDLDDSLYFRLPHGWLDGTVTLTAFAYSHDVTFPWTREAEWENNFEQEVVVFHEAQPLELHLATLHLHRSYHPSDLVREYAASFAAPTFASESSVDTSRIIAGLWRYHPISELSIDVFPVPVEPLEHDEPDEWDLGDCSTTVIDGLGTVTLADWRPLMADPEAELTVDAYTVPDRATIWVMDRTISATHFYPREDGSASVFGSMTGGGPAPIPGAPAYVDGCPNENDESGQPNTTLGLWRVFYDWSDEREFFVGMVHPSLPTRWAGLASSYETAWVKMNPNLQNADWYYRGAATMAHEVAHLTGLNHVACADGNDDGVPDEVAGGATDPTHPQEGRFPSCSLAEVRDHGYYGFDVYFESFGLPEPAIISNNPAAPTANRAYPLLSYASPRWIDPYHYCRLLVYYGVDCDPATIDEPFNPPGGDPFDDFWVPPDPTHGDPPNPGVPLLLVTGTFDPDGGGSAVRGILSVADPPAHLLERLERQAILPVAEVVGRLVARAADGTILDEVPIADRSSAEVREDRFAFDLLVPLRPGIATVEVLVGDDRLAALEVSATAPTATWTSPAGSNAPAPEIDDQTIVSFEVGDADGDPVTSTLLYSPDGSHWHVVASGIAGTEHRIGDAIENLPGSDGGTLRLLVSDGVHTTVADREPTVRIADRAPSVRIETPRAAQAYPAGHGILLVGWADDLEDRDLPEDAFAWSSSVDGPLGSGRELVVDELSAGEHTLELVVTDSGGSRARAAVEVAIDAGSVSAAPAPELETTVDAIYRQLGSGEDPAPAIAAEPAAAASSDPPLPLVVGLSLALGVLIGVVAWTGWRTFRRSA